MIDSRPHSGQASLLSLEVQPRENPDWPVVRILVDGADPFEDVAPGWLGFDPDVILGRDSPLLPALRPRRVAVYRCSCGEAGCGVIAPAIQLSSDGRHVRWRDFANFVAEFFGPLPTDPSSALRHKRRWNLPDLLFESEQYAAAIAEATADRTWETPRRRTARLLFEHLEPFGLILPPDLPLRAVEPAWNEDGFVIRFGRIHSDGTLDERTVRSTSTRRDPAEAARQMAERLLATGGCA